MLITSKLAAKPNLRKFPIGRKCVETVGIILLCALMTTVAVQLIVESVPALAVGPSDSDELKVMPLTFVSVAILPKGIMFLYCFALRQYP